MKSEICVRTQGIKGGNPKFENKGTATLYITDEGQERSDLLIDVDSFVGQGINYKRRDQTLINIRYKNEIIFNGNIETFVKQLKK